ncbi:MAG: TIGR02147 family protein [Bdellovibrionota bacterium]
MLLDYLKKEFNRRKKKNKSYSIRAYAKSLKTDASTLSKVLAGKRKLSYSMAKKIIQALKLDEAIKNTLLLTYADTNKKFLTEEDFFVPDEKLSAELMSKWEYYTVLSYLEVNSAYNTKTMADALKTSESTVSAIIKNLLQLEIIKKEKNKLLVTGKMLTAPSTFDRASLQKVHSEYINKALNFLKTEDTTHADFSGITIAISSKRLKEAAERIKDFRRSLGQFLSSADDTNDSVYRINFQFFPVVGPQKK